MAEEIDREVKQTVDNAHHIALTILQHNRELLEQTAEDLLQKEILEGSQLREYINQAKVPSEVEEWLRTGRLSEDKPLLQTLLV